MGHCPSLDRPLCSCSHWEFRHRGLDRKPRQGSGVSALYNFQSFVPNAHVFLFLATLTWSQPDTHGDPPSPRHGHTMVAVGTKLYIHGGLAGDVFYNDLFCIDISKCGWRY